MPATKTNLKVSAISYVILYVKDTQKALEFYRDTLGAKVKASTDGWVELDMGQTTLALHHERDDSEASGSGSATVVFDTDHIDDTYETLKKCRRQAQRRTAYSV